MRNSLIFITFSIILLVRTWSIETSEKEEKDIGEKTKEGSEDKIQKQLFSMFKSERDESKYQEDKKKLESEFAKIEADLKKLKTRGKLEKKVANDNTPKNKQNIEYKEKEINEDQIRLKLYEQIENLENLQSKRNSEDYGKFLDETFENLEKKLKNKGKTERNYAQEKEEHNSLKHLKHTMMEIDRFSNMMKERVKRHSEFNMMIKNSLQNDDWKNKTIKELEFRKEVHRKDSGFLKSGIEKKVKEITNNTESIEKLTNLLEKDALEIQKIVDKDQDLTVEDVKKYIEISNKNFDEIQVAIAEISKMKA